MASHARVPSISEEGTMAGTFEGLSDLEWKLFADRFPAEPTKRGRGMPHPSFRQVSNTWLSILVTGCRWCDLPRGHASPSAWTGRGPRDDSVAIRWCGGRLCPLAKAAVRGSPMAAQAKGSS